jgi:hypothetical protein
MTKSKKYSPSTIDKPDFDAYEINELSKRARKSVYYKQCKAFVLETLEKASIQLTEKQLKWLWGIKKDLKGEEE